MNATLVQAIQLAASRTPLNPPRKTLKYLVEQIKAGTYPQTARLEEMPVEDAAKAILEEVRIRLKAEKEGDLLRAHGLLPGEEFLLPKVELQFTNFGNRFGAAFIDGIIMRVFFTIMELILKVPADDEIYTLQQYRYFMAAQIVEIIIGILYFAFMESSPWQATLGKRAVGIRVTDLEGRRISFLRALGRYMGKFVSTIILFIGFLMSLWTQKRQALHDIMASTVVLQGNVKS